jgi:AcrR family transcriptional regulator
MKEVADLAGISEALIFKYFHTKEELYLRSFREVLGRERSSLPWFKAGNPKERLREFTCGIVSPNESTPKLIRIIRSMIEQQISKCIMPQIQDNDIETTCLVPIISEGMRTGVFKPGDPAVAAAILWRFLLGCVLSEMHFPSGNGTRLAEGFLESMLDC